MDSQNEKMVQMAIAEAKLGNRKKAKAILVDLVGREPDNPRAPGTCSARWRITRRKRRVA